MDRSEEEMKFVGFFGIFKESFKTIFSLKKIFAQITITLILPSTIVILAHTEIYHHLFWKVEHSGSPDSYDYYHLDRARVRYWLCYWLFEIAYFTFFTVLLLLSTAAVVFTIGSVYTGREVVYRKVMKVVPKVWKRLLVIFLYIFLAFFIFSIVVVVVVVVLFLSKSISLYFLFGGILGLILFVLGFLYLIVVWQLASVVTVLENAHGLKAIRKGKDLVKGKKRVGMSIAFVLNGFLLVLVNVYVLFVSAGQELGLAMVWRVMIGISCGLLLMKLFLLFIVIHFILYLVCKSHHWEAIDKLSLSTYLGAYLGETVLDPKVGEEIQLERPQPPPQV